MLIVSWNANDLIGVIIRVIFGLAGGILLFLSGRAVYKRLTFNGSKAGWELRQGISLVRMTAKKAVVCSACFVQARLHTSSMK